MGFRQDRRTVWANRGVVGHVGNVPVGDCDARHRFIDPALVSAFHPLQTLGPTPVSRDKDDKRDKSKSRQLASDPAEGATQVSDDGPEQEALFNIEGPDERGRVWVHGTSSRDPWAQSLGPADKVAEVLSQWLASLDDAEMRNEIDAEEARERDA